MQTRDASEAGCLLCVLRRRPLWSSANVVSPSLSSAIELVYGGVYCFLCQDYIYDRDIEAVAKEEQRKAWKMQGVASTERAAPRAPDRPHSEPGPGSRQRLRALVWE